MRSALLLVSTLGLAGCGAFPAVLADHTSDPTTSTCDSTTDFAGGAAGWARGNTRVYVALGVKYVQPCGAQNQTSVGAKALVIHEFRKE